MDAVSPLASSEAFRLAMRRMAATVSIITTELDGVPHGMTATAVSAVSADPPSLLVAINQSASIHAPLCQRGAFWVNLLGETHSEQCLAFSGKLKGDARFGCGAWRREHEIPLLEDAQANLFCRVEQTIAYATHTIFIAAVRDVRVKNGINPLIYFDGRPQFSAARTS
jgi:flavin reductase (DIM6/NTAB) family NADH-FMN oxidoreductase RutF